MQNLANFMIGSIFFVDTKSSRAGTAKARESIIIIILNI